MQTSPEKVQENQAANFQQTKSLELEAAPVAEATSLFSATKLDDEDLAVLSYKPCTSKAAKSRAAAAVSKAKKKEESPSSSASIASSDYHDTASAGQSTASADTSKKRKTPDAVDECSSEGSKNQTTLRNDEFAGGAAWSVWGLH